MSTRNTARRNGNFPSTQNIPIGFSFNYTENFNRIVELDPENYATWKTDMLYLLDINNLIDYITIEKIKKYKKNKINNLDNYIIDKLDNSIVYQKDTDPIDIKNDNITKWVIINSLGKQTRKIIGNRGKTAFETWKILENSFTKGKEQLKSELKTKIENLKYNTEIDINIFIAALENIFEELEYIDTPINDEIKVGIFNRSLPENLRFINVFQFKENWVECKKYAAKIIPDIIFSNLKEKNITSTTNVNTQINTDALSNERTYKPKRRNGKCSFCKKFGHYSYECRYKNFDKNKRNDKYLKQFKSTNKPMNTNIYKNYNIKNKYKKFKKSFKNKNYALNSNIKKSSYKEYKDNYINLFNKDYNTKTINEIFMIENEQSDKTNKIDDISVWIIDSGASTHITNHANSLINKKHHEETIMFANGKKIKSTCIGDFVGYINDHKIILKNVLLVPAFKRNLISVSKLIEQNFRVIFHSKYDFPHVSIYNQNGDRIITISVNENTNTFKLIISKYKIIKNNTAYYNTSTKTINNNRDRSDKYLGTVDLVIWILNK